MNAISDTLIVVGAAMLTVGCWEIHPGLGMIVGGLFLVGFGWFVGLIARNKRHGHSREIA